MKKTIVILTALLASIGVAGQELPRRPLLGVKLKTIDQDTRRVMNLKDSCGVLVESVIPSSTAERAGFKKGDVLLSINKVGFKLPEEAVRYVASSDGGASFSYELIREGEKISGNSVFQPMPFEIHNGIEMKYTAVQTVNGLQRLIVSKLPGNEKRPVIVFIGGIGCYSLDSPLDSKRSEVQLLNQLTRKGFVCVRAEKPGVGDNRKCTPCNEVSFSDEVSGYVSAVNEIKKYDFVDSTRVFVLGHSMGGVMAPLIAQKSRLKGIIAYGTIGSGFLEYLIKTRRTITDAEQMDPVEAETYVKDACECAGYYFVEGMSIGDAAAKKRECEEHLSVFNLRSGTYNRELYALNVAGAWKTFSGKALLIWGEGDYISYADDHRIIADAVNHYHPGQASMLRVKNASHSMQQALDFKDAVTDDGPYNPEVGLKILAWLKSAS